MEMNLDTLKSLKIWIPFMLVPDGDMFSKRPSIDGMRYAKWKKEAYILMPYAAAVFLKDSTPGLAGVGLSIPEGVAIIDLDKCVDDSGAITPAARTIVDQLRSYTELSPSGKGLHVIVQADLSGYSKLPTTIDSQSVEVLTPGNFVTYTANALPRFSEMSDCTSIIRTWYPVTAGHSSNTPHLVSLPMGCKWPLGQCQYAITALASESDKVRLAKEGQRTRTLFNASVKMGNFLRDGHLTEQYILRELTRAATNRVGGLTKEKCYATIKGGMAVGKTKPRTVDCGKKSSKSIRITFPVEVAPKSLPVT